ncbi:MAG: outer membrane beta-barrel protein [Elusimicrobiota bacterium]
MRKLIAVILTAGCAAVAHAAVPALQVIGFEDTLTLQAGDQFIQLTEGSLGFSVPEGVKTTVLSGRATMSVDGALVLADAGDTFSFLASDDGAQILVLKGELSVTLPGKPTAVVGAGQFLAVSGARTGAAAPPAAPTAVVEPVPAPAVPETEPSGDPLTAIGDAFHKLARVRPREIKFLIELHPFYALTQIYDSNIYAVPKDKADGTTVGGGVVGSWITRNTFGSKVIIPLNRRHRLETLYDLYFEAYSRQPSANNSSAQHVSAHYEYNPRRSLKARLDNDYRNTEDPAFSELVTRKRRYQNTMRASIDNERSRIFVYGFDASNTHHKYLDGELSALLNRYEASFGGYGGIKLRPRAKLFMHYHRESVHYSAGRTDHSKSHRLGLGVSGRLAPKLEGAVDAGAHVRRYGEAPVGARKVQSTLAMNIGLNYQMLRRTAVGLKVQRSIQESTALNNRYFISTGGSLSVAQDFSKLRLDMSGGYEAGRYPDPSTLAGETKFRRDDTYSFSVGGSYRFKKWLSAGLRHEHRQRLSNFPEQYDFRVDRTSMDLRVEF